MGYAPSRAAGAEVKVSINESSKESALPSNLRMSNPGLLLKMFFIADAVSREMSWPWMRDSCIRRTAGGSARREVATRHKGLRSRNEMTRWPLL